MKTAAMRSALRAAAPLLAAPLICAVFLACKQDDGSTSPTPLAATATLAITTGTPPADQETDTELSAPLDATPAADLLASARAVLPDPALTPGDVLPAGVQEICVTDYSSRVRNVTTATNDAVYAEYYIVSHTTGQYEVDHLIPLELGGSNSIRNLWPEPAEPRPGFHEKDALENRLHALVCDGSLDLLTAQRAMVANWWIAYIQYEFDGTVPTAARPTTPPAGGATTLAPSAVVAFTSVVGAAPGGIASATVRTAPGAPCSITYVTPAGTTSRAQGLLTQIADADGIASWRWTIGTSTHPGVGTLTVTCGGASVSASITIG